MLLWLFLFMMFLGSNEAYSYDFKKKSLLPLWERLELKTDGRKEQYLFQSLYQEKKTNGGYSKSLIKQFYDAIYANQNPTREECKKKRFLVLQVSSTSFEGTGSLMKQILVGTAVAMHSNRVLIWGLGYHFPFEVTKELWNGPSRSRLKIVDTTMNCSQSDMSFGPFGCFLMPISTCHIFDAKPDEIVEFGTNPFNVSHRLMVTEVLKGIALYQPPKDLFDYLWEEGDYPEESYSLLKRYQAHIWSAAVTAYVFRLKKEIVQSFHSKYLTLIEKKMEHPVWGIHVRHGDLKAMSRAYRYKQIFEFPAYFQAAMNLSWKLQYTPRTIMIATDSAEADNLSLMYRKYVAWKQREHLRNSSDDPPPPPTALEEKAKANDFILGQPRRVYLKIPETIRNPFYVPEEDYLPDTDTEKEKRPSAGDSDLLDSFSPPSVADLYDSDDSLSNNDDEADKESLLSPPPASSPAEEIEHDPLYVDDREFWFDGISPTFGVISNSQRYRTHHGSHTVASNGGCFREEGNTSRLHCAIDYDHIIQYQSRPDHKAKPRSYRMMRVFLESFEDLYVLSLSSALVGTGSSQFTTLAALLVIAREGIDERRPEHYIYFLDHEAIRTGYTPTAFLHGQNMFNGTEPINDGDQRWKNLTYFFITGLPDKPFPTIQNLSVNLWANESLIQLKDGLPQIDEEIFYYEALTWLGNSGTSENYRYRDPDWTYRPTQPGHCYSMPEPKQNYTFFMSYIINLALDHLAVAHPVQAMQCWSDAHRILNNPPKELRREWKHLPLDDWELAKYIVRENVIKVGLHRYTEPRLAEMKTVREYYEMLEEEEENRKALYWSTGTSKRLDSVAFVTSSALSNQYLQRMLEYADPAAYYGPKQDQFIQMVEEELEKVFQELQVYKEMREFLIFHHEVYFQGHIDPFYEPNITEKMQRNLVVFHPEMPMLGCPNVMGLAIETTKRKKEAQNKLN